MLLHVTKGGDLLKSFEQIYLVNNTRSFMYKFKRGKVQHLHVQIVCISYFELFWKNSSYVSGLSVCIFVALCVRISVAEANNVEGTIYSGLTQASIRGIAQMQSLPFR